MKKHTLLLFFLLVNAYRGYCQDTTVTVVPALAHLAALPNVRDFTLATAGTEAYLTIQSPLEEVSAIAVLRKEKDGWSEPELVPFTGQYKDLEPFLAPDNQRLYFVSNRPLADSSHAAKDFDIWYVDRPTPTAPWGLPVNLGPPVNTDADEFYPTLASNNNLYFTSDGHASSGKDDIFFSAWLGDHYGSPVALGPGINTAGYEYNAYVAPDESFLLFGAYQRPDGQGSGDLYLSTRDAEQQWRPAVNLGLAINSRAMDYCPFVDLPTGTLYFTSRRSALGERPGFKNLTELQQAVNSYQNGWSRIYQVPFDPAAWKW
ncbi:MAG: hypothetical protein DA408_16065 [Bacteroidetes bacterium]|nr:MAG: hypothetical protein C7N36_06605 [Bacteroidota bacterium]PTM10433.1 MAG: hypothetical protein DA408_16065 [Bacteroidota bacterium]